MGSSPYFGDKSKTVGFGDVSSGGWAKKKDDDDGGDGEGGGDEDVEKEVQVKKSEAVVQLEEVETSTGEEDETTAFQVRAKLFVLGTPGDADKEADAEKGSPLKGEAADKKEEKKESEKKQEPEWVVIGIGNLKINIPKPDCTGALPPLLHLLVQNTAEHHMLELGNARHHMLEEMHVITCSRKCTCGETISLPWAFFLALY